MSQAQNAVPLVLSDEDRAELGRWLEGGLPWLAERARIVLACAEPGSAVARVASELGSTRMTVRKWRRRFAENGLAGLSDDGRGGAAGQQLAGADAGTTGQDRAGVRGRGDERAGRSAAAGRSKDSEQVA